MTFRTIFKRRATTPAPSPGDRVGLIVDGRALPVTVLAPHGSGYVVELPSFGFTRQPRTAYVVGQQVVMLP